MLQAANTNSANTNWGSSHSTAGHKSEESDTTQVVFSSAVDRKPCLPHNCKADMHPRALCCVEPADKFGQS